MMCFLVLISEVIIPQAAELLKVAREEDAAAGLGDGDGLSAGSTALLLGLATLGWAATQDAASLPSAKQRRGSGGARRGKSPPPRGLHLRRGDLHLR